MKVCFKCGVSKELSDFYTHPRMDDGHLGKCKECTKKDAKEYYDSNIEDIRVRQKKQRNQSRNIKIRKLYRKSHREQRRTSDNKYYMRNKDKFVVHRRKRRALKKGVRHEDYNDNYIFERDGWICGICGRKINKRLKYPNRLSVSIDHIVPLSLGGDDRPINVQAAHLRCNLGKNARNTGQLRMFA